MTREFINSPPISESSKVRSPTPVNTQWHNELMFNELRQQVKELQQQVKELQQQANYLKSCCGVLFDNDTRLATWVYFAHPVLYEDSPPQFERLKAYPNYPISQNYPFQTMEVYACGY